MSLAAATLVPCGPADLSVLARLIDDPGFGTEFTSLASAQEVLADANRDAASTQLALVDGAPIGFTFAYAPPSLSERFAMIRVGVLPPWRRRGIGSMLLASVLARFARRVERGGPENVYISTWLPNPAGEAFARRHGFRHTRFYWHMERPPAPVPAEAWPAGVTVRTFEGTEESLRDWNDAYNASFAEHHLSVITSVDDARLYTVQPHFRPAGLFLAYRAGRCVGFCRTSVESHRGSIAILGTTPEARGIGLGRALLRAGVAFLATQGIERVDLLVDGENETALRLYRSEGFETTRTREVWRRPVRGGV